MDNNLNKQNSKIKFGMVISVFSLVFSVAALFATSMIVNNTQKKMYEMSMAARTPVTYSGIQTQGDLIKQLMSEFPDNIKVVTYELDSLETDLSTGTDFDTLKIR